MYIRLQNLIENDSTVSPADLVLVSGAVKQHGLRVVHALLAANHVSLKQIALPIIKCVYNVLTCRDLGTNEEWRNSALSCFGIICQNFGSFLVQQSINSIQVDIFKTSL